MKLKNKETGEIVDVESIASIVPTLKADKNTIQLTGIDTNGYRKMYRYKSLAELNEEWEEYGRPKEHWYINFIGGIEETDRDENDEPGRAMIEIGNYFETEEEAEKVVEKLKAWKRLRDKGFRFTGWGLNMVSKEHVIQFVLDNGTWAIEEAEDYFNLLFGGKE